MDPFSMVVAIVLIATIGSVVGQALKNRQRGLDSRGLAGDEEAALRREIRELRARVEALEAIATDPRQELKREFSRLEAEERRRAVTA